MTGGEGSPSVLESVAVRGSADVNGYQDIWLGVCGWPAASQQIGPRPSHGVLDNIRDERCQCDGNQEWEVCRFVLGSRGAGQNVVGDEDSERNEQSIYEIHSCKRWEN